MKVFISINNLECGGAQKSLISLLNYLKVSNGMDIDLLVLDESDVYAIRKTYGLGTVWHGKN